MPYHWITAARECDRVFFGYELQVRRPWAVLDAERDVLVPSYEIRESVQQADIFVSLRR